MVILQTLSPGGGTTCLDSSSSQVARPGLELRPAKSERHIKKIRGLLKEDQGFLWRVLGVLWEAR